MVPTTAAHSPLMTKIKQEVHKMNVDTMNEKVKEELPPQPEKKPEPPAPPPYANHPPARSEINAITGPRQKPVITVVRPTVEPRKRPTDKTEMSQAIRT